MGSKQIERYAEATAATPVPSASARAGAPVPEAARRAEELARRMASVHIYRVAEMPRIELYLDQVLVLVADELSFMCLPGEQILTGSMVNNYVKQRLLPAPKRRRYTRRHLAALLFVCAFKRVYSIAQISAIMSMIRDTDIDQETLYDDVCAAFERSLAEQFAVGPDFVAPVMEPHIRPVNAAGEEVAPEIARILEAAVASLAAKVYVEQTLGLAE